MELKIEYLGDIINSYSPYESFLFVVSLLVQTVGSLEDFGK